ncbi:MAG TPA: type II secretion system protein GspC, partial [Steroidobacteraceae bacterium]|nr:type II secretion system protein GspC [Steroidobacteraceae bacterium]
MAQAPRFSATEIAGQIAAHAPSGIMYLLGVLLAVRGALLVMDLAGVNTVTAKVSGLPAPAATRKVVDIPSILRTNLFGQSAAATGTDAPLTTMNLKLKLVFADNDPKRGVAALGPDDNDIKDYQVGDEVPGGARLNAVYMDRVLLDRDGSIEALPLPVREPATPDAVRALPPPMTGNPVPPLQRVQQAMQNNPGLLNQVIQRQAVFADGHLRGMRVNPGTNAQAFARLGLKAGDLVTAINGAPLDDPAHSNDVFNSLNGAAEAHVTVVRNGKEQ